MTDSEWFRVIGLGVWSIVVLLAIPHASAIWHGYFCPRCRERRARAATLAGRRVFSTTTLEPGESVTLLPDGPGLRLDRATGEPVDPGTHPWPTVEPTTGRHWRVTYADGTTDVIYADSATGALQCATNIVGRAAVVGQPERLPDDFVTSGPVIFAGWGRDRERDENDVP